MTYAPIILFIYNRPDHALQTLEALAANTLAQDSDLFIFADGPKENATSQQLEKIHQTREVARSKKWCKSVTVIESEKNKGLAASIISGVTEISQKYGKVIVLEDDIVTGKYFLKFMNDALNKYENEKKVWHIAGWRDPVKHANAGASYFYPVMDCWGWATWADRWQYFKKDVAYYQTIFTDELKFHFNMDGAEPDYWAQIEANASGKINTWAIFWYATIFLKEGLCLAPTKSLVRNVGFDNTGVHCGVSPMQIIKDSIDYKIESFPGKIEITKKEYRKNITFFKIMRKGSFGKRIVRLIKNILRPFYHVLRNPTTFMHEIKLIVNKKYRDDYNEFINVYDYDKQDSANYIYEKLASNEPVMIARFGSVELNGVCRCLAHREKNILKKIKNYISDKTDYLSYNAQTFNELINNAGFFSADKKTIEEFTDIYLEALKDIDILGSWQRNEKYVKDYFGSKMKTVPLGLLEPWKFDKPAWSRILKGKKVLVVHPFESTIHRQYRQHDKLFKNPDILPDFDLVTLKAVQSIAGEPVAFNTWFDALHTMENEIRKIDFDIAILGCGAYGLPLASFIKKLGKKAVHLGGATQLLFGIKGKRWEDRTDYRELFNDYWINPLEEDIPSHYKNVENGCYW